MVFYGFARSCFILYLSVMFTWLSVYYQNLFCTKQKHIFIVTCDWWVNSEKQVANFAIDGVVG